MLLSGEHENLWLCILYNLSTLYSISRNLLANALLVDLLVIINKIVINKVVSLNTIGDDKNLVGSHWSIYKQFYMVSYLERYDIALINSQNPIWREKYFPRSNLIFIQTKLIDNRSEHYAWKESMRHANYFFCQVD